MLTDAIWRRLGAGNEIRCSVGLIKDARSSPDGSELAAIAKSVPKRRAEFIAGRHFARNALFKLGQKFTGIPAGVDRAPVWPSGYVGSISHSDAFAGAIAAYASKYRGVGLDLENAISMTPETVSYIATPYERRQIDPLGEFSALAWTMIFSAKEAAFKAMWPSLQKIVDYKDVSLEFCLEAGTFHIHDSADDDVIKLAPNLTGTVSRYGGLIITTAIMHRM